jgi:hypothetical protein
MIFYTTEEQERLLDLNYNTALEAKKKEISDIEKQTGKPHKYTAEAYINIEQRTFYVDTNSKTFIIINDEMTECFSLINFENASDDIIKLELNGSIYKTDKDFDLKVKEFISKYNSYYVQFYPAKLSAQMSYVADKYEIPAKIYSEKIGSDNNPEETIELEDEDKYDLCWF